MSSKAERLAIAAAVAPELRRQKADGVDSRQVIAFNPATGEPVRVLTVSQVQASLLTRAGIEIDTDSGGTTGTCSLCSRRFRHSGRGRPPKTCRSGMCASSRMSSDGAGAHAEMRSRGEFTGGEAPYGYRVEAGALVAVEAEQAVICEARALRAAGLSLRAVAAKLDRRGMRTRAGKVFAASQIARMAAT